MTVLAKWTTNDPRSHYGQAVWRWEEEPVVGDRITVVWGNTGLQQIVTEGETSRETSRETYEETVRVIYTEDGWIVTLNQDSSGSEILAFHTDSSFWGVLETSNHTSINSLNEMEENCEDDGSIPEETLIARLVALIENGELKVENTIQIFDGLGALI